jgi:hypothetical protein
VALVGRPPVVWESGVARAWSVLIRTVNNYVSMAMECAREDHSERTVSPARA